MTRLIAACALILAWGTTLPGAASAAASLVHARSFKADAQDASEKKVPIMVLFSSPECHYCERVKREYLVPMQQDPAYRKKAIFREVTVGANRPLTDFDGTMTTEGAFAARHKVFMVPTVQVFDPRGNDVGEPIVGLLIPDFYFGYLEAAIQKGMQKLRTRQPPVAP